MGTVHNFGKRDGQGKRQRRNGVKHPLNSHTEASVMDDFELALMNDFESLLAAMRGSQPLRELSGRGYPHADSADLVAFEDLQRAVEQARKADYGDFLGDPDRDDSPLEFRDWLSYLVSGEGLDDYRERHEDCPLPALSALRQAASNWARGVLAGQDEPPPSQALALSLEDAANNWDNLSPEQRSTAMLDCERLAGSLRDGWESITKSLEH